MASMENASETTGLDIATAIAAAYAALVATLALAFNIFSWLRTWQTRLKVGLRRMMSITPGTPGPGEPVVLFDLMNQSGHLVKVTHVTLAPIRGGGKALYIPQPFPLPAPGSFEIQPRDSTTVWVRPEVLADGDPEHKTRALISTADGQTFKSKRVRVRDLLEDQPDEGGA